MEEHKAQIRPMAGSAAPARSALPPHVEAMLLQAARLGNSSSSHATSAANGLASGLLDSSDAMTDSLNSPLSSGVSLPLVPLGVSSPERSCMDDESDADSDLNEVDDAPKHAIIPLDSEDEDDAHAHAVAHSNSSRANPPAAATSVHNPATVTPAHVDPPVENAGEDDDDEEEEVDDSTYCYCQQKWSGNEMMVSCDQCLQWFHADCMGIPPESDMAHEEFKCDACRLAEGLPANNFPLPRRNRRAEIEAARTGTAGRQRKGGRARNMSQRKRDALEDAPVRGKVDIEVAQQRSKARAAKRAQKQADKAAGMSKQQRADKRAKERAARKQQRTVTKARQEKADTAGGLKNLLASFDQSSSSESSSSDSSDSDSSDSSSEQAPTQRSPAAPAAATAGAGTGGKSVPSKSVVAPLAASSPSSTPRPLGKVTPVARKAATGSAAGVKTAFSAMWEPVRAKVRESLTPLLGASLGTAVEASLFELQRGAGAVYKSQWRDIIANLKDPKNDLKNRVVSGLVSPAALSRMTAKELASSELANLREEIRKDAVKMSVRAVSPPRAVMPNANAKADHSLPSEAVVDIVNSMIQEKQNLPVAPAAPSTPTSAGKSLAGGRAAPGPQTSLDSLPVLPSFDEVVRTFQSQKKDAQANAAATNGDAKKATDSARLKKKALNEKNAAIAAAANAALAASKAKARAKQAAGVTTISDSSSDSDNDSDGEAKAPSAERVGSSPKKGSAAGAGAAASANDAEELMFETLGLPPMDVWNGDLLLSAGANPSILTNYFPLTAKQIGGPPVFSLPLPSRIEEKLRIDLAAVESYLLQVLRSASSKRVVVVELHLSVPAGNSGAAASTLVQDFEDFCRNYRNKKRALAFDYQKDSDPSNRMLLYVVPPDTTGSGLTEEFVRKHLRLQRPRGTMWGVALLPKDTYALIAKKISRVGLERMQAQAQALERANKAHQETVAAAAAAAATAAPTAPASAALSTATTEAKPTPPVRTGPVDPRARPTPAAAAAPVPSPAASPPSTVAASVQPQGETAPTQAASTSPATAASVISGSQTSSSSVVGAAPSLSSSAVSSSTGAAAPSSLVGSGGLASLLAGGPGSFDALSSYLSSLVGKVQPAAAAAATASVPIAASTSAVSFPPPPPPPVAPQQQVSPAPLSAPAHFPPPPPTPSMPVFPPPPQQQQHQQQYPQHPGLPYQPQPQQHQLPPPPQQHQLQAPYGQQQHAGVPYLPPPPPQAQQHTPSPQAPHQFPPPPPPAGQFQFQPQQQQQHPLPLPPPHHYQQQQAAPQQFQQMPPPPQHHMQAPPQQQQHFAPPPPPHQQHLPPPPPPQQQWQQQPQQQPHQPQHYALPPPPPPQHLQHPHGSPQFPPPPPMQQPHLPPPPPHMQQQAQPYNYGAPAPLHDSHKRPREEGPHGAEGAPPPRRSRFGPALDVAPPMHAQQSPQAAPTHFAPPPPSHRSVKDGPPFIGQGVCRFFFSPRGCVKDRCAFSHDPAHAAAAQQANAQQAPRH